MKLVHGRCAFEDSAYQNPTCRRLPGGKHTLVSVRVFEHRKGAPGLFGRRTGELHSTRRKLLVCLMDVVAVEGNRGEGPDAILVAVRREQNHAGFGARYRELDPSLFIVEGLVRQGPEAELLCVEEQRAVLIGYRNAREFDSF